MRSEFILHDAQSAHRMEDYVNIIFDETKGCDYIYSYDTIRYEYINVRSKADK